MKTIRGIALLLVLAFVSIQAAETQSERELIRDNHFRNGFVLWETRPGKHVRYAELKGFDGETLPVWGLSQWSSRFPLDAATALRTKALLICSNAAKTIMLSGPSELSLSINSALEYGPRARTMGEPWVHLLVEQEFDPPAQLSETAAARLHVEARLLKSDNRHRGDYSPNIHAAQFQIFFTVQNRNRQSTGFGDLLWFGIPIYDNRERFPKAFQAKDFGGTAKFIFTPGAKAFTTQSAHDGQWIVIDKDLLPLMREALETAWSRGFLPDSKKIADYAIGGMNMGWELPGTFDVEMQVRKLSLKVKAAPASSK